MEETTIRTSRYQFEIGGLEDMAIVGIEAVAEVGVVVADVP